MTSMEDIDTSWWDKYKVDLPEGERGPWKVEKFTMSQEDADLSALRAAFSGNARHACFPGDYTKLTHEGTVVMSDTFAEIRDHMTPIKYIESGHIRRILIHGLGLGMVTKAALACDTVEHIDVVEIDQDVIDLVGPHYSDPRLHIHQGDALTYRFPPNTMWDLAWHDIWTFIDEDNRQEMIRLHRRYGSRVLFWQGSWSRDEVEHTSWGRRVGRELAQHVGRPAP